VIRRVMPVPSLIRWCEEGAVDEQLDGDDGHTALMRARVDRPGAPADEGGDSACWSHLVCPSCGMLIAGGHLTGCEPDTSRQEPRSK
jgi:hypothetical protein